MTFPLKRKFDDGDLLPEIYLTLGKELGAIVVPVDLAWHEAARRDPQIVLYKPDNIHPAPAGTYLAACCFALTLWGAPARPFPAMLLRADQGGQPLVTLGESQANTVQMAATVVASQSAGAWAKAAADLAAKGKPATRAATSSAVGTDWVDLFNRKDTSGWIDADLLWTVESETLIGKGGQGFLDTERTDFANFHLQAEAMINDGGNSGVLFRRNRAKATRPRSRPMATTGRRQAACIPSRRDATRPRPWLIHRPFPRINGSRWTSSPTGFTSRSRSTARRSRTTGTTNTLHPRAASAFRSETPGRW